MAPEPGYWTPRIKQFPSSAAFGRVIMRSIIPLQSMAVATCWTSVGTPGAEFGVGLEVGVAVGVGVGLGVDVGVGVGVGLRFDHCR